MENLLDKAGLTFVASYQCATISGVVHIVEDAVYLIDNTGNSIYVKKGTPDQIKAAHLCNFHLLEPGEPESKEENITCNLCGGLGYVQYETSTSSYTRDCDLCGGSGAMEKPGEEPTISKEEGIKEPVTELIKALREYSAELGEEQKRLLKELDNIKSHKSIRRKGAFQLLAGMLASGGIDLVDLPDNEEAQYVADAIRFTDLLLKKLGE